MCFEHRSKVYGYECDVYGHLNNANYLNFYEQARAEMLEEIGLPLKYLSQEGIHIYVKSITLDYLKGVKFGDEIIIKSRIEKLSRVKSVWHQEIYSTGNSEATLMNRVIVEGVFTKNGKPYRIPPEMEAKLQNCVDKDCR